MSEIDYIRYNEALQERCEFSSTDHTLRDINASVWSDDLLDLVSSSVSAEFKRALVRRQKGHELLLSKLGIDEAGEHQPLLEATVKIFLLGSFVIRETIESGIYRSGEAALTVFEKVEELGKLGQPSLHINSTIITPYQDSYVLALTGTRPQDSFRVIMPSILLGHGVNIEAVAAFCYDRSRDDASIPGHKKIVYPASDLFSRAEINTEENGLGVLADVQIQHGEYFRGLTSDQEQLEQIQKEEFIKFLTT